MLRVAIDGMDAYVSIYEEIVRTKETMRELSFVKKIN